MFRPPGRERRAPAPLIVALHWASGSASAMARVLDLSAKAARHGAIVAYPEGTGAFRSWNAGHCCGNAPARGVDDVGFIRHLLDELESLHAIDTRRVFVTGISNGGMMAHWLGAMLSDRVAAIAPVAADRSGQATAAGPVVMPPPPWQAISVVMVHGHHDEQVRFHGGHGRETHGTRQDLPVSMALDFWRSHTGCPPELRRRLLAGGTVLQEAYGPGRAAGEVVLYTMLNGGHEWPGVHDRRRTTGTQRFSATDAILEFFQRHPRAR